MVFHDGTDAYLADGFHRCLAAQRLGRTEIAADVQAGTRVDALWWALGANRTNGQRLTAADKRHAILLALAAWPELSANQIAEQIGCSQRYVSSVRDQVRSTSNLPSTVTGKDGKTYPARRAPKTHAATSRTGKPVTRKSSEARREEMTALAAKGYSVPQIADAIGLTGPPAGAGRPCGGRLPENRIGASPRADRRTGRGVGLA